MKINKTKMQKLKGVLGVVLIASSIGTMYYWETFGREQFLYKEVLVLKESAETGSLITEKDLVYTKLEEKNLIENPLVDPAQVVGMEAKQYIPKNAQLSEKFFESPEVVLEENQFIFSIPRDWIKAIPSSLRRKDKVFVYEVKDERRSGNFEIYKENQEVEEISGKEAILTTVVAYVKDNANREVRTVSEEERFDGTATVSEIEIIATSETVEQMKESVKNGNRFIITYR